MERHACRSVYQALRFYVERIVNNVRLLHLNLNRLNFHYRRTIMKDLWIGLKGRLLNVGLLLTIVYRLQDNRTNANDFRVNFYYTRNYRVKRLISGGRSLPPARNLSFLRAGFNRYAERLQVSISILPSTSNYKVSYLRFSINDQGDRRLVFQLKLRNEHTTTNYRYYAASSNRRLFRRALFYCRALCLGGGGAPTLSFVFWTNDGNVPFLGGLLFR